MEVVYHIYTSNVNTFLSFFASNRDFDIMRKKNAPRFIIGCNMTTKKRVAVIYDNPEKLFMLSAANLLDGNRDPLSIEVNFLVLHNLDNAVLEVGIGKPTVKDIAGTYRDETGKQYDVITHEK